MNKTNIMSRAWDMYKEAGCTTRYEFGVALRAAWAESKNRVSIDAYAREIANTMNNGWTKQDLEKAFYAKYPQGMISMVVYGPAKVRFTNGGKVYQYRGNWHTVGQKLGFIA